MRSILRFRSNRRAFSGECLNSTVARISKLTPAVNAIRFIFDAMKKIDPDQEDYSLGHPGQVITQLHPDFDPRTYELYADVGISRLMPMSGLCRRKASSPCFWWGPL